jgi:hypothetical protein
MDDTCKDCGEIKKHGFTTFPSDVMIIPSYMTNQTPRHERRKDGCNGTMCGWATEMLA